jgi:5-hydroxyisourate hydrolase-like protein (transthyretin family)
MRPASHKITGVVVAILLFLCILVHPAKSQTTSPASTKGWSGTVVLPDGSPAKGCDVYFFAQDKTESELHQRQEVKSDNEGAFHFDGLAVDPMNCYVIAVAKGWGMGYDRFLSRKTTQLRLAPAIDLTVHFVDAQGKPAPDVPICLRALVSQNVEFAFILFPAKDQPPFAGKTDSEGAVTFVGLPQSTQVQLTVNDDRFAALTFANAIQLPAKSALSPPPIQLHAAASISGKVVFGATGKPAAGINVAAQSQEGGGSAITSADGTYKLNRLEADKYNVALDLKTEQEKNWTAVAAEGVSIGEGEQKQGVDLSLITGGLITGNVLSKVGGKPIAGVYVGVYGPAHPRSGAWVQNTTTAADGAFSLRVPPGEQYVYLQSADQNSEADTSQNVTVVDGKTTTINFRMTSTVTSISGKIVGPDGAPVSDAEISVTSNSGNSFSPVGVIRTPDGLFELHEGVDRNGAELRVRAGDLATRTAVKVMPDSRDIVVHLEKNVLASVAGRVVDQDGKPISGVEIQMIIMNGRFGTERPVGVSDENGRYQVDNLFADSKCAVVVQADGFGRDTTQQLKLKPGEVLKVKDLVLKKRDTFIAGMLLDEAGNPAVGQRITVQSRLTGTASMTTDKDGKFRLAVVKGDKLSLIVQLKDHHLISKSVQAGDQDIMIDPLAETAK